MAESTVDMRAALLVENLVASMAARKADKLVEM
jgi:hypothetical protein